MKTSGDIAPLAIPPALLAEIRATADAAHEAADEVLRDVIERGLVQRRLCNAVLARVEAAEASIAQCQGTVITPASMSQLAADVKRRGRDRLAGKIAAPL